MQQVTHALNEVQELYKKILGRPAPEIPPGSFVSFPPGVSPIDHAIQEVEQLKQLAERIAQAPGPVAWIPRADTYTTQEAWVARLEVPGIARENVKVLHSYGECIVRGEKKPLHGGAQMRLLGIEQPWGPFERRFTLPQGCRTDQMTARCTDGVLELRIPFENEGRERETKIEVA